MNWASYKISPICCCFFYSISLKSNCIFFYDSTLKFVSRISDSCLIFANSLLCRWWRTTWIPRGGPSESPCSPSAQETWTNPLKYPELIFVFLTQSNYTAAKIFTLQASLLSVTLFPSAHSEKKQRIFFSHAVSCYLADASSLISEASMSGRRVYPSVQDKWVSRRTVSLRVSVHSYWSHNGWSVWMELGGKQKKKANPPKHNLNGVTWPPPYPSSACVICSHPVLKDFR